MLGIRILIIVVCLLVGFIAFLYFSQSRYVYFPERTIVVDPSAVGLEFESIHFKTADGLGLFGWFVPCDNRASNDP